MADAEPADFARAENGSRSSRKYLIHGLLSAVLWAQGTITALEFVFIGRHMLAAPSFDAVNDPASPFFLPDLQSVIVSDIIGNVLLVAMYAYAIFLLSRRAASFRRFTVFLALFHLLMAIGAITMTAQFDPEGLSFGFWRSFDIFRTAFAALILIPPLLLSSRLITTFAPETKY
jgi:hypothetical protein